MFQKGSFAYFEDKNYQAIELPYMDNELSMLVVLPKAVDGLPAVEKETNIYRTISLRVKKDIQLFLPKFKIEASFQLKQTLAKLGAAIIFSNDADFTGIASDGLQVDDVIHKAVVDVNEEGTEAAAATAVIMEAAGIPMPQEAIKMFKADHPFVFVLQDIATGNILFIGRVSDPTK